MFAISNSSSLTVRIARIATTEQTAKLGNPPGRSCSCPAAMLGTVEKLKIVYTEHEESRIRSRSARLITRIKPVRPNF